MDKEIKKKKCNAKYIYIYIIVGQKILMGLIKLKFGKPL